MVTTLTRRLTAGLALAGAFAFADPKIDQSVTKAEAQIDKGNVDGALKGMDKVIRDAANPEAQVAAARVLSRAGKLDEALASAKKAAELAASGTPELRANALHQLATLELRIGAAKDALGHAQEAAKLLSTPDIVATLVRAQAKTKDPAALETADKLVKDAPTSSAAHDARGRALTALGLYDEADAELAKAIELDPKSYLPYLHRAMAFVEAGKGVEAEAAARKATEIDPRQGEGFAALGAAIFLKNPKDFAPAIAEAQQGAFLAPNSPFAQYWVGRIFESEGNLAQATNAYKHAIEIDPGYTKAAVGLINSQARRGELDAAAAQAAKLAQDNPNDGDAQLLYGQTLVWKNNFTDALEPLERAVKRLPNNALAAALLGTAYQRNRQYEDAADAFKRAVELQPGNVENQVSYALVLGLAKRYADGIAVVEKVVHTPGYKDAAGYMNLGWLYRNVEPARARESVAAYQKALELDPKSSMAALGLGWAQYTAKAWTEAMAAFEKASHLDPKLAGEANLAIAWSQYWSNVDAKNKDMSRARAALEKAAASLPAADPRPGKLKASIEKFEKAGEASTEVRQAQAVEQEKDKGPDLAALVGDLGNAAASIRIRAARQMAAVGAPAVEYLMRPLRTDRSIAVRAACAKSLGSIGAPAKPALPHLQQESESSRERVMLPAQGVIVKADDVIAERELQEACQEAIRRISGK